MVKKRVLALILCAAMSMSVVGCGSTSSSDSGIPDGTYTGEGTGKGGKIVVELTMKNSKISDIKVVEHGETPGYADALEKMSAEMITKNTLEVDMVSGATLSSTGILEAVKDAFNKTGASTDKLVAQEGEVSKEEREAEYSADVIVLGGGGAGLTAAIEAAQNGASVILVEKMPINLWWRNGCSWKLATRKRIY